MWKIKKFKTESSARKWIKDHSHLYICELVFIENEFLVEYKYLHVIKFD